MFKKLVGLAAVGGFLYAHKRRGGQLTLDSFKQTARSLVDDFKMRARDLKASAEQKLAEQQEESELGATSKSSGFADQTTGYGSSGYGYSGGDINRR
jgi:hypothetical protein